MFRREPHDPVRVGDAKCSRTIEYELRESALFNNEAGLSENGKRHSNLSAEWPHVRVRQIELWRKQ